MHEQFQQIFSFKFMHYNLSHGSPTIKELFAKLTEGLYRQTVLSFKRSNPQPPLRSGSPLLRGHEGCTAAHGSPTIGEPLGAACV